MCRHCGDWFCSECLVYSFGPKKPPFCVGCALAAAGVRSNAGGAVKMSRREMKRREKAAAKAMKAAKQEREQAPAASLAIDWSSDDVGWDESRAVS